MLDSRPFAKDPLRFWAWLACRKCCHAPTPTAAALRLAHYEVLLKPRSFGPGRTAIAVDAACPDQRSMPPDPRPATANPGQDLQGRPFPEYTNLAPALKSFPPLTYSHQLSITYFSLPHSPFYKSPHPYLIIHPHSYPTHPLPTLLPPLITSFHF
jgi:hypothetical protein